MTKTGRKRGPKPKLRGAALAKLDELITADVLDDATISANCGVSVRTVCRRRAELLASVASKRDKHATLATEAEKRLASIDPNLGVEAVTARSSASLEASLVRLIDHGDRMLVAADAWLRDPQDPNRYYLGPRTHEVLVIWERLLVDGDRTYTERTKELLSDLLRRCEPGGGPTVQEIRTVEVRVADPRKLLLEAVATLKPVVEVLGKTRGELKTDGGTQVNVFTADPTWLAMRDRLVAAFVEERPELLEWFLAIVQNRPRTRLVEATVARAD